MKPAAHAVLLGTLLFWTSFARAADVAPLLRYNLSVSFQGFHGAVPTAALEKVHTIRRPPPQAMDLWKDCLHPQVTACARSPSQEGEYAALASTSWQAFGSLLTRKLAPDTEAVTRAHARRLQGTFSLVSEQDDVPSGQSDFASGKRLLLAIASRPFKRPEHGFSGVWSSTTESGSITLPAGYEVVSETFVTVELKRCSRRPEHCDTEILFQHAYPGDGVGGFDLPAVLFNGHVFDESDALMLYVEQRISLGPASDGAR